MNDDGATVTKVGVLSMQICVPIDWTDDQAQSFANREVKCGTEHGWGTSCWMAETTAEPALLSSVKWNDLPFDERTRLHPMMIEAQILHLEQAKAAIIKQHKAALHEFDAWIANCRIWLKRAEEEAAVHAAPSPSFPGDKASNWLPPQPSPAPHPP